MEICKDRGLGYHDEGLWLPVMAFADNIWLFAKTPKELEHMFRAWITVMREYGLYTMTKECTWTSTHNFTGQTITDERGERVNHTSGDEGFKALGAKITMIGDDNAELNSRLHKAWQAFYKHKSILCNRRTNVEKATSSDGTHYFSGCFLGCRILEPARTRHQELQACQNTMHRMIVGMDTVEYAQLDAALKKAHQEVHKWRKSANIDTWTHKLSQRRFRWVGHVARMSDNRPANSILIWRGSAWLKKQELKFGKGRQGHRRHLHVRRWESWVARWRPNIEASQKAEISNEWMNIAQDRTEWCGHVEKHAEWTNTVRLA